MADQEFLASFAVDIDEAGVTRLQTILSENRELAEGVSAAFDAASESIRSFAEQMGLVSDFSAGGITAEGMSGLSGLKLGLDLTPAQKDLNAFIALAKKPIPLSAGGSGIVSAGQSAYNSIKSIFSTPITIRVNVTKTISGGSGDGSGAPLMMSTGGRFSQPTDVQVAEDGDAEYIIPVKKEDRAVPLLRQLLSELSPAARESLAGRAGDLIVGSGVSAGMASVGNVTQDNRTVSAPVSIQVTSSGADAEAVGQSIYNTAERYLLRTLRSAFPGSGTETVP